MNSIDQYLNKIFLKDIMDLLKELPEKSVDMFMAILIIMLE